MVSRRGNLKTNIIRRIHTVFSPREAHMLHATRHLLAPDVETTMLQNLLKDNKLFNTFKLNAMTVFMCFIVYVTHLPSPHRRQRRLYTPSFPLATSNLVRR